MENIIAYHISADDTRYTSTIVACEEDDAASVDGGESSPQFDWLGEESLRKIYNVHFPLGSMGMSLSCLGDSLAVVTAVVPGGYAHSKGVLPMDVVVGVAGKQLTDYHEVTHMILCLTRPLAISFARNRLVGDGSSKNSSRKGSPTPAPPPNPPLLSTPHEGIGIPSSLMLESSSDDEDHDAHSQPTAPVARSPVHEKPPTGARRRDPSATAKKRMSFHKQTPGPLFPTVDSLTQLDSLQHKFPAPEVSATDNTAKSSELSSEEVNVVRGVRGLHDITLAEQVLFAKEEQDARKTESVATETFYPASRSVFERWVAEDGDEITPATTPQVSPKNSSEDSSAPVSKAVPMPVRATATVSSAVPESSPVYSSSSSSVGVSSLPVTGERTPLCVKQPSANSWEYEAIFFRKPYGFTITKNYWDCAMVSAVIPGGKASQQQMAVGDTIVAVNRQWTQRYEDVLHHLQRIDRQAESGSGNNTVLFLMKRSMSFMMSSVTASLATESARVCASS